MAGGRTRNEAAPAGGSGSPATWETQQQAVALRAGGATYREIGRALSIDHTWARRLVVDAIRENTAANVDELRAQEGERLEKLHRAIWPQALGNPRQNVEPNLRAALTVIRIAERRARLFGLDAPVRVEVSDQIDRQLQELAAQIEPMMLEPNGDGAT